MEINGSKLKPESNSLGANLFCKPRKFNDSLTIPKLYNRQVEVTFNEETHKENDSSIDIRDDDEPLVPFNSTFTSPLKERLLGVENLSLKSCVRSEKTAGLSIDEGCARLSSVQPESEEGNEASSRLLQIAELIKKESSTHVCLFCNFKTTNKQELDFHKSTMHATDRLSSSFRKLSKNHTFNPISPPEAKVSGVTRRTPSFNHDTSFPPFLKIEKSVLEGIDISKINYPESLKDILAINETHQGVRPKEPPDEAWNETLSQSPKNGANSLRKSTSTSSVTSNGTETEDDRESMEEELDDKNKVFQSILSEQLGVMRERLNLPSSDDPPVAESLFHPLSLSHRNNISNKPLESLFPPNIFSHLPGALHGALPGALPLLPAIPPLPLPYHPYMTQLLALTYYYNMLKHKEDTELLHGRIPSNSHSSISNDEDQPEDLSIHSSRHTDRIGSLSKSNSNPGNSFKRETFRSDSPLDGASGCSDSSRSHIDSESPGTSLPNRTPSPLNANEIIANHPLYLAIQKQVCEDAFNNSRANGVLSSTLKEKFLLNGLNPINLRETSTLREKMLLNGMNPADLRWMKTTEKYKRKSPAAQPKNRVTDGEGPLDLAGSEASDKKRSRDDKTRTPETYRNVYTETQRVELEKTFQSTKFISVNEKNLLAGQLGLSKRQIKIWFQNRRAKERKVLKKIGVNRDQLKSCEP